MQEVEEKRPFCFGEYDNSKEFCRKICRHSEDCISLQKLNKDLELEEEIPAPEKP